MKYLAKNIVFQILSAPTLLERRYKAMKKANATIILNLHRVAPPDKSAYNPLSPQLFEDLIVYCKSRFDIVTVSESFLRTERPKMVISFDDGYDDFYEYALPILESHRIKVNQNVIPQCILDGLPPLDVILLDFIGGGPAELVRGLDIPGYSFPIDKSSGRALSAFIRQKTGSEREELKHHILPQVFNFQEFKPTSMMTLEKVREVANLHEVGVHSFAHCAMEYETNEFLKLDVTRCKDYFSTTLGLDTYIYAFPYGSYKPMQPQLVQSMGIPIVLLVGDRLNGVKELKSSQLFRYTFDAQTTVEMRYKANGRRAEVSV